MSYKAAVVRCTIAGSMYGGSEVWSTHFWLGHPNDPAAAPTFAAAEAIRTAWTTFFTANVTNAGRFSNRFQTDSISLTRYSITGDPIRSETQFANIQTPITGAAAGFDMPAQIAVVGSLRSALARGRAAKGRMFLPGPAVALEATGKIKTTDRDGYADRLKAFFDAIKASADVPWDPILVSPGTLLDGSDAIHELMTGVRVGDVLDTQRRRRNSLQESYAARTLA